MPPIRWSARCRLRTARTSARRSGAGPVPPSTASCSIGWASRSAIRSRSARSRCRSRATIEAEPDKITDRLTVGPRVFVSLDTLRSTGLIDPGSLVSWRYALKLGEGAGETDRGLVNFTQGAKQALPEGGFTIRDRRDPSPQVSRTLDRLRQFLTLVGLTALLVGGVGVANAVATYIDRRRKVIAVFKSLGATSSVIFGVHLVQVLLIAGIGIVIGIGARLSHPGGADLHAGRCTADQGRPDGERAQRAHGRRLRPAGVAGVHAVAAGACRAGARRRAVSRRGGAGAGPAARTRHGADGWRRRCCWRDLPSSRPKRACSRSTTAWAWWACSWCFTASARRFRGPRDACVARGGPSSPSRSAISAHPAASPARWCCRSARDCRCSSPWLWSIARSSTS